MNILEGQENKEYKIQEINTNDEKLKDFLFTLGCFENQEIQMVSKLSNNIIIKVKDAKYSIDNNLAKSIIIEESM